MYLWHDASAVISSNLRKIDILLVLSIDKIKNFKGIEQDVPLFDGERVHSFRADADPTVIYPFLQRI